MFGKEQRVKACGFLRGLFVFPSGMENIQAQSPCLELCAKCWVCNLTSSNQETSCAASQTDSSEAGSSLLVLGFSEKVQEIA